MEKWQRRGRQITDLTCEDWDRVSQGLPKDDERHEYVKMAKDIQSTVIEQVIEDNSFVVGIKTASIELNFRREYSIKDVRAAQEFLRVLKILHREV